jgi:hypothetical protein
VTIRRPHLGRRPGRVVCRAAAGLVVVVACRALLGWWGVAVLLAAAVVAAFIAAMAAVEARASKRRRVPLALMPVPVVNRRDHVAFARALTAVASAYLSACEREDHPS